VFSDKTGTLTANVMSFRGCSVGGVQYLATDSDGLAKIAYTSGSKFFRILALCNTVMPEPKDGKILYSGSSPDEIELASFARNFGYIVTVFLTVVSDSLRKKVLIKSRYK
jgi:magnesium-transporting ATPase (P-type)